MEQSHASIRQHHILGHPLDPLDEDRCEVVLLLRTAGKSQDSIVKVFDDLIWQQAARAAHSMFQPLLSEFFMPRVFKFHKAISDEQENITSFESYLRGRLGNEV